ncbi:dynein regulatory complex subunit 2-like [Belonocnema kinseyi]|uniref:dynein regulatory complex subunit 2-like n=1 Tax=Belonocnema kinseyi TaxID=2817044 RepID=UPI00143CCE27|nr:dynein regulatory complex subunit 2-like [Belonocnema kinseyi]
MPPKVETQTEMVNKKAAKKTKAAEKKEKKRLEAEERAKFLKKEHLRREIDLGARNVLRFQRSWREMVMKMKMPGIKEDIEVAWRTFERALDTKDYSISLLLDAIDDAEEQYQMNERSHIENIDRFVKIYKMRLATHENNFLYNMDELLTEAESEICKINNQQTEDEAYLQVLIFAMNQRLEESLNNFQTATFTKVEASTEDFKNLRRMEANFLNKSVRNLWRDLKNIVSNYTKKTKNRRNAYEALKEKDDTDRNIINHQLIRTATLFEEIRKFREKVSNLKSITEKKVTDIRKEQNFFQEAYGTVKKRFLEEQSIDKHQLKTMAVEYNRTTEHLSKLVKKLEQILRLVQICRKFETEDEKIIPSSIPIEIETENTSTPLNWKRTSETASEPLDSVNTHSKLEHIQAHESQRYGSTQFNNTGHRLTQNVGFPLKHSFGASGAF